MKVKWTKFITVFLVTFLVCTALTSIGVYATHTTMGYTIAAGNSLEFILHQNFASATVTDCNNLMYDWNHHAGRTLTYRHATTRHTKTNYGSLMLSDKQNYIYRKDVGKDNYVAQTKPYYSNGILTEADINVNIALSFVNSVRLDNDEPLDIYFVLLHEVGHVIGLNHSTYPFAVMGANYKVGYIYMYRTLRPDDITGVRALYR